METGEEIKIGAKCQISDHTGCFMETPCYVENTSAHTSDPTFEEVYNNVLEYYSLESIPDEEIMNYPELVAAMRNMGLPLE